MRPDVRYRSLLTPQLKSQSLRAANPTDPTDARCWNAVDKTVAAREQHVYSSETCPVGKAEMTPEGRVRTVDFFHARKSYLEFVIHKRTRCLQNRDSGFPMRLWYSIARANRCWEIVLWLLSLLIAEVSHALNTKATSRDAE